MIECNYLNYISDLNEVKNEFDVGDTDIRINGEVIDSRFYVTIKIADKVYAYDYPYAPKSYLEEKRFTKRYLKLSLYKALSGFTGVTLPWGALTGIRPTKLAYMTGEDFERFFLEDMLVSPKKTQLIAKILQTQKGIYCPSSEDTDLFVSIPFCPTRCRYCSFISNEIAKETRINEYIDRLIEEITLSNKLINKVRSVYIGGGTPVALSDQLFEKLLSSIKINGVEYTVEAGRPDAITKQKLDIMKAHSVTRVCVNPQTFNDKTLAAIGRHHTAKDIIDKYELTKSFGFDVNMDLIAGLPGESFEDFAYSIDTAAKLEPENITVHTLCLKKGSLLKESTDRLSDGEVSKMVDYARQKLTEAGYNPYYLYRQKYMAGNLENTGYAKAGKECIYNIDIMEETVDIMASGANAISKKIGANGKITRIGAPKNTAAYIERLPDIINQKNLLFGHKRV